MSQKYFRSRPISAIKYEPLSNPQFKQRPESGKVFIPVLGGDFADLGDIEKYSSGHSDVKKFQMKNQLTNRPFSSLSQKQLNKSFANNNVPETVVEVRMVDSNDVQPQDKIRGIPVNIQKDKETLYREIQLLKAKINDSLQQNQKLKAKNHQMKKEIDNLQSLIQNVEQFVNTKQAKNEGFKLRKSTLNDNILMTTMKKQLNEYKSAIKQKDEQLNRLKKDVKICKVEELLVQIRESQIEALRLRTLLDQQIRNQTIQKMTFDQNSQEEKNHIQLNIINSLKQENDYLKGLLKFQEEEMFRFQSLFEDQIKSINLRDENITNLKDQITKLLNVEKNLQEHLENKKERNIELELQCQKLQDSIQKVAKLEQEKSEMLKTMNEQKINIEYLDKTCSELKFKLQERSAFEAKEKRALMEEKAKMQSMYEDLDDRYKNLQLIQAQNKMKETMVSLKDQTKIKQTQTFQPRTLVVEQNVNESVFQKLEYAPKKLRTVKTADVKDIGVELNMRLRIKRLDLQDAIEQYLFEDQNKKSGIITIKEINERISSEPFLILDKDKAFLISRYLIEDNSQEFVELDFNMSESLIRVRSIFAKLIGNYNITTQDEEHKLKEEIILIIIKYKSSLKTHFDSLPSKQGMITRRQILDTFIYMDIEFRVEQLEFIFLQLFLFSNKVDRFDYNKMFDIFQPQVVVKEEKTKHHKSKKDAPGKDKMNQIVQIKPKLIEVHYDQEQ